MPIFFLLIGVLLVIVSVNNKVTELGSLVKDDFAPKDGPGFGVWIVALFIIGALGYVKTMKPVANAFLILVVVSMIIANRGVNGNGGFFDNFSNAFKR